MPRHGLFSCALTWVQLAGLVALSACSSAGWLAGELLPGGLAPLAGQGVRLVLLGLPALALASLPRWKSGTWNRRAAGGVFGGGILLVALPFLLLHLLPVAPELVVLVFSLVPVGALLVEGRMRLLPWALAGPAGLLFLLPITLPGTPRGLTGLALTVVAAVGTVAGLVVLRRVVPSVAPAMAFATVALGSGALLLVSAAFAGPAGWSRHAVSIEAFRAVAVDLPPMLLLLWLLRSLSPVQAAARYLLTPLLTFVAGWALVRQALAGRMALGMVLLAAAAFGLLRTEAPDELPRISPR